MRHANDIAQYINKQYTKLESYEIFSQIRPLP